MKAGFVTLKFLLGTKFSFQTAFETNQYKAIINQVALAYYQVFL